MNFVVLEKKEYTPLEYCDKDTREPIADAPVFVLDVMTAKEAEEAISAHFKGTDYVAMHCKEIRNLNINGKEIKTGKELVEHKGGFFWANDVAREIINLGMLEAERKND